MSPTVAEPGSARVIWTESRITVKITATVMDICNRTTTARARARETQQKVERWPEAGATTAHRLVLNQPLVML